MSIQLDNEVFNDDLPSSINYDPQVQTIGDTMDVRWQAMLPIVDELRVLCNIPAQSESILDLLAFQFQVLFYSGTFNIADPVARVAAKQTLISNNFDFHAHLGTPGTMQTVISTIYQNALIQEWFNYGGTANHYRILFDQVIDSPTQALISATQQALKRASQAFDGFFVYNVAGPEQLYIAVGVYTQIFQFLPLGIPGQIGDLIACGATVTANASIQTSSSIVGINAGATVAATGKQLVSGATHLVIAGGATMTNTARILRGLSVLIKAGHG
jgi:P2-related tail formation protein/uncharacterized Zn-binding protein involved in type VI secretion